MHIDDLSHLLRLAETGTLTEAAKRAHLSQPAFSAVLARLEAHFGAPLFHRGRTGATPTAAGSAVVPRVREALATLEDARRAAAEISTVRSGEVRISAGATVCTYFLPPLLAAFRREHPGVRLVLRETTTDEARDGLLAGDLDLAIMTSTEGDAWIVDELVLVSAPGVDASRAPFATFTRGGTTRQLVDRVFPRAEITVELGSLAAILANVRAGIGISLVSRAAVADDVAARRLVVVPHRRTPVKRPFRLVHRGVERLSPAAAALRALLLSRKPRKK